MPTNTLTDAICKAAKPAKTAVKLFDGGGLHLYITPAGAKVWRMAYRFDKKPKQISFGAYPLLGLAAARVKRDAAKAQLREGVDPMAPRRAARSARTLSEAWETYWDGRKDVTDSYRSNVLNALKSHLAKLKDRPVASIDKPELLEELMVMDAKGHYDYVRKVRMWIGQVLDWCVEQGDCDANVASQIRPEKAFGKGETVSHASLPANEIGAFMHRLGMEGQLQSVLANHMLALTWVRTGELRGMVWSEISGDLWRIPKERMKRRREHLVPLSTQALKLLTVLKARSRSEYVFPSDRRQDRPMSENSILYLIHRCGYKERMTGHGWRSVASTWANEAGFNEDAIERQLAHAPEDEIRAAYNNAKYLPERRKMLQAFADWIDLQVTAHS
ncbi:MAG: integrase arm-type DNA-binding domain-containing protein [Pseudomonadota bacterium]